MQGRRVLVAGATGYVGRQLVDVLLDRGVHVRALIRTSGKLAAASHPLCEEVEGDVLDYPSLQAACAGCWAVVSCIGAMALSKMPYDQIFQPIGQGMELLFKAARQAGASRLVVLSSLNSESCRNEFEGFRVREQALDKVQLQCEAIQRKQVEDEAIAFTVINSSMFFKDSLRIFKSVRDRGRISAFGGGLLRRYNPIDGRDLAIRLADSLETASERNVRIAVGGPDVVTLQQIGLLAANAVGRRRLRYRTLPLWTLKVFMWAIAAVALVFPNVMKYHAFAQFLAVVSTHDAVGEQCGDRHLRDYFKFLHAESKDR